MDDKTMLDAERLSDLLHAVADSTAPVCGVDVARARQAGGRQRVMRRLHLPWAAPAAAAAVALIAALGVPFGGHARLEKPASQALHRHKHLVLMPVPGQFSAQTPYVSFGWLPPGFKPTGLPALLGSGPTGNELDLQAAAPLSDGRVLSLSLYSVGQCRMGGPTRVAVRVRGRVGNPLAPSKRYVTYPLSSSCVPLLARQVAPIGGGRAYQSPEGGLYWEYGRNAWAYLLPGLNAALPLHGAPAAVDSWMNWPSWLRLAHQSSPDFRQSAASWQLLRDVATRLRFSPAAVHPLYGFTLSGLPASWGSGYPASMAMVAGRVAATGWSTTGPTVDPGALSISVWPVADHPAWHCNFVPGQSSYITLDGASAMLRVMSQVGKHWQELCVPDVAGMSVEISMDVWSEGAAGRPLPGWPSNGVLAVFGHMHLLVPQMTGWTRDPQR
jgi:hypothetical protein